MVDKTDAKGIYVKKAASVMKNKPREKELIKFDKNVDVKVSNKINKENELKSNLSIPQTKDENKNLKI